MKNPVREHGASSIEKANWLFHVRGAPYWTKVQYLSCFSSHRLQIMFYSLPLSRGKPFESLRVHSPRLAAFVVIPAEAGIQNDLDAGSSPA